MIRNSRVVVILGPTAVGKSGIAVELAKKLGGEIISADSRQVYRGLNIGTGKITEAEMEGVPHHLLDVAEPKKRFTVVEFQKLAREKITEIFSRGHLPIICGGTGFYIEATLGGIAFPNVPPNEELRKTLAKKSAHALFALLKRLDPKRAEKIDPRNIRRVIRAIEISRAIGKVPPTKTARKKFEVLKIGITLPPEELKMKIAIRLFARMREGLVEEARALHVAGLSWKRMEELGLEYRFLSRFLRKKITEDALATELHLAIWHFARRQMTWFRRDSAIKWFRPDETKKIWMAINTFLRKKNPPKT